MNVLMISLFYRPDQTGIAVTSTEAAEWFAERGDQVTVVTGPPFYPEWRIRPEYRGLREERLNGVRVLRTRLYVPRSIHTLTRLLHEASFAFWAGLRAWAAGKPDVLVVVSPPLSVALPALALKYLWRRRLLLNVKDLVPDAAIELGMLRGKVAVRFFYLLERFLYRHADRIASLGQGVLNRIENKGVDREKLCLLPDTADPVLLRAGRKPRAANSFIREERAGDQFLVLHSGNMGVKQGIEVIIEAARLLQDTPIAFYLVGEGAVREKITALAQSYRLSNVRFLPLQPRDRLVDMYHAADVCLLTQRSAVVDIVVPSKLVSMMSAGCCVVASVARDSEAARIVEQSDCGSVVAPENPRAFAEEIRRYSEHPERIGECRRRAREFVTLHFDRERIMSEYRRILLTMSAG